MKIGIILDKEITKDQRVLNEIEILEKHGHQIFVLCLDLYNLGQTCKIGKNISVTRFKMSNRQR